MAHKDKAYYFKTLSIAIVAMFVTVALLAVLAPGVYAQSQPFAQSQDRFGFGVLLPVRGGEHSAYSRIVLDWPTLPQFSHRRAGSKAIDLSFGQPARVDLTALRINRLGAVRALEVRSALGQPLVLRLRVRANARYRVEAVGNKVVIDIFKNAEPAKIARAEPVKPEGKPVPNDPEKTDKSSSDASDTATQTSSQTASGEDVEGQSENETPQTRSAESGGVKSSSIVMESLLMERLMWRLRGLMGLMGREPAYPKTRKQNRLARTPLSSLWW